MFLIVAASPLLNELYIILSYVSEWGPTFWFNFQGTIHFFFLNITFAASCAFLIKIIISQFFIIKAWKGTEETRPKRNKKKYRLAKLGMIFHFLQKLFLFVCHSFLLVYLSILHWSIHFLNVSCFFDYDYVQLLIDLKSKILWKLDLEN